MIYLDTSVVLAQLLTEDYRPSASLWDGTLVASRLMEYEVWTRLHARGLTESHGEAVSRLIGRVALLELSPPVLTHALDVFPVPVRTLDAPHLASCDYLRNQGQSVSLASYDHRMTTAARALAMPVYDLEPS